MNAKANRQVVVAKYSESIVFKVPKGIDLDDKTQVKQYWMKWNRLHIEMINGEEIVIDTQDDMEMKYPTEMRVEDYDEYYDEETESESEEEPTETEKKKINKEQIENKLYYGNCLDCGKDDKYAYGVCEECYNEMLIKEPDLHIKNDKCIDCGKGEKFEDGICEKCYDILMESSSSEESESDEEFVDEMNTKIDALIEKASSNMAKAELIKELEKEMEGVEIDKLKKELLRLCDMSPEAIPSFIEKFGNEICLENADYLRERIIFILNYNMGI